MKSLFLKLKNNPNIELFITGFIQIFLVTANTYLIAHSIFWGMFIVGFVIAFLWSYNVKRIAFGTIKERLIYAIGAAFGGVAGLWIVELLFLL